MCKLSGGVCSVPCFLQIPLLHASCMPEKHTSVALLSTMQLLLLHLPLAALALCNFVSACPLLMGFSQEDFVLLKKEP